MQYKFKWLTPMLLFCGIIILVHCKSKNTYTSKTKIVNDSLQVTPVSWLSTANIYEVNIRQFTPEGTFASFQKHIPRLKEMGVHVLWLMPVQPIGIKNRKETLGSYYSIRDYTAVNPEFGTMQDFKTLVQTAHENGMKVILDWVANHSSWDNVWMEKHPEYYAKDSSGKMYAPYDWSDVVQLDHKSEAQQNAMAKAMEYWVTETDIDGFRCDMAHLTPLHFWKKARLQCDQLKQLFWLAETQDEPYFEAFDVIYGWEWLHKMEDYYKGKTNMGGLDSVINQYNNKFSQNKFRMLFTSNHDENSWQDTEYKRLGEAARAFAAICAVLPGVPLIYSGQEEPLLRKLNFFNKDDIGFNQYTLSPFYKALLTAKKNNPALGADKTVSYIRLNTSSNDRVFAFLRKKDNREVLLISNLSATERFTFEIMDNNLTGKFKNIQNGEANDFTNNKSFLMNPWEFVVYEK